MIMTVNNHGNPTPINVFILIIVKLHAHEQFYFVDRYKFSRSSFALASSV